MLVRQKARMDSRIALPQSVGGFNGFIVHISFARWPPGGGRVRLWRAADGEDDGVCGEQRDDEREESALVAAVRSWARPTHRVGASIYLRWRLVPPRSNNSYRPAARPARSHFVQSNTIRLCLPIAPAQGTQTGPAS